MELKFNKNGDAWVAEFEATDKFNLHMEGLLLGSFSILQRTAGGKYTHVRDIPTYPRFDKVFDYDFNALVYPKYIKIVSETEPTYAEVVSDGEITEIKSQTKEVEVTANGTTQVAPDAGYSYLTGVTVKTNVPMSGGGGGGNSSGLKYYDVANSDSMIKATSLGVASIVKLYNNEWVIAPAGVSLELGFKAIDKVTAFGVDWTMEMLAYGKKQTTKQFFESMETIDSLTEITKEEFYNLG